MKSKTYILKTLGCKANLYDSQLIEAELQKQGWNPSAPASLCIVNSCTVTDEADRQTRKLASRLLRENPDARIVVTGCAAEVDPERLAQSQGVHYVIGNRSKPELVNLILKKVEDGDSTGSIAEGLGARDSVDKSKWSAEILSESADPFGYPELLSRHPQDREWPTAQNSFLPPPVQLEGHSDKTRAYIKLQEGCNSFCTYCIIPYARGPSRSLSPNEVLAQVRTLVQEGVREVVLTGTNIGDYGSDFGDATSLTSLLNRIFQETDLERLRVSSLDPTEITPAMMELMAGEPRFCPHFHVSLQSPDSRILRLMKRRYGFQEFKECLEKISALPAPPGGVFVGMDVITGFPGESDDDFNRTYDALAELPWSRLHVFPYSERNGTPATRLPGVVNREKRVLRSQKLKSLSQTRLLQIHDTLLRSFQPSGRKLEGILLEKSYLQNGETWVSGFTPNYLRVLFRAAQNEGTLSILRNRLISARPLRILDDPAGGDVAFEGALDLSLLERSN